MTAVLDRPIASAQQSPLGRSAQPSPLGRSALAIPLSPGVEAHEPPEARGIGRGDVRLLVSHGASSVSHAVFSDLAAVSCDILTLGQYLRPSPAQLPVERYLPPAEFAVLRDEALRFGFRHVEAGPLVRSSYHAWKHVA